MYGGDTMDSTKIVKRFLLEKDSNAADLARRLGCGSANIYNKYSRNNFSVNEIEQIANAYNCDLIITFRDRATGEEI